MRVGYNFWVCNFAENSAKQMCINASRVNPEPVTVFVSYIGYCLCSDLVHPRCFTTTNNKHKSLAERNAFCFTLPGVAGLG